MPTSTPAATFDPNSVGLAGNQIFGLPFPESESRLVLLPVPWDVTVSYGGGTHAGPEAILNASYQVDLYDADLPGGWKSGMAMRPIAASWLERSATLRAKATRVIQFLEEGGDVAADKQMSAIIQEITTAGEELRRWVREQTTGLLQQGKLVGLVGGDHSTPLGFFDAIAARHPNFGILQIDAHCDLRNAYEGFRYSHASIMWNALQLPQLQKLVQVGIRDCCEAEVQVIADSAGRVQTFFDTDLKRELYSGTSWKQLCDSIIRALPQEVYVSFDIDGLDPKLCPNTGTPVPGGLEFDQAAFLLRELVRSGRRLIGFDLNEVSPGETEWDANVGARMLYKLCNLMLLSHRGAA